MMDTIKRNLGTATDVLHMTDMNASLRAIAKYAWLSAGIFFASYLYFIGAITFSVIKQESLAQSIKTILSETSKEELKYLNAQKNLTEGYARQEGFVSASAISYTAPVSAFAWNLNVRE